MGSGVFLQRACLASICPWLHFSAFWGPLCATNHPPRGGAYLGAILWGSSLVLSPPSTLSTLVMQDTPFCQTPACSQTSQARARGARGRPTQKVLCEALQGKRSLSKRKGTGQSMDVIGRLRFFCRSTAPCCQTTSSASSLRYVQR